MEKKGSCLGLLLDLFLTIVTGGLWLIVLLIKFFRKNS